MFNNLLQSLFKSEVNIRACDDWNICNVYTPFRNKIISYWCGTEFIAAFFNWFTWNSINMMTITIAAITIGIAVDNSIHYIYRFKEEYSDIKDYNKTIEACHSTVGRAILNTSITIVFGFSILILSKFIPTIYFGIFTGIAMLLAMISVLTLLPSLILFIRPFENQK